MYLNLIAAVKHVEKDTLHTFRYSINLTCSVIDFSPILTKIVFSHKFWKQTENKHASSNFIRRRSADAKHDLLMI